MSSAPTRRMTPDDLLRMPDDGKVYELVDGEVVEKKMALESILVALRLVDLLLQWRNATGVGGRPIHESPFQCFKDDPSRVRKPDVAYLTRESYRMVNKNAAAFRIAPDLAVEVISPTNSVPEIDRRRHEYLDAGTRQVWIINPYLETIQIHRPGRPIDELHSGETLVGDEDLLPGFRCDVSALFEEDPNA